jgi:hypothetical protein
MGKKYVDRFGWQFANIFNCHPLNKAFLCYFHSAQIYNIFGSSTKHPIAQRRNHPYDQLFMSLLTGVFRACLLSSSSPVRKIEIMLPALKCEYFLFLSSPVTTYLSKDLVHFSSIDLCRLDSQLLVPLTPLPYRLYKSGVTCLAAVSHLGGFPRS